MIHVVAKNRQHFVEWCKSNGLYPGDRQRARYCVSAIDLRGRAVDTLKFLPDWTIGRSTRDIEGFLHAAVMHEALCGRVLWSTQS